MSNFSFISIILYVWRQLKAGGYLSSNQCRGTASIHHFMKPAQCRSLDKNSKLNTLPNVMTFRIHLIFIQYLPSFHESNLWDFCLCYLKTSRRLLNFYEDSQRCSNNFQVLLNRRCSVVSKDIQRYSWKGWFHCLMVIYRTIFTKLDWILHVPWFYEH